MYLKRLKFYFAAAACSVILFTACKSNSSSNESTTNTTDSSTTMMVDTTNSMNNADSTSRMGPANMDTTATTKPANTGMAKPDPAKKGKKGKVAIEETTVAKVKADATPDASGVYKNVDYIPSFPGGYKGLQKYFDDNLVYPAEAQDQGVEGTVRIAFTVDEKGKLMNAGVEGQNEGYGLDEEALRVINKMPTWVPGKINGKPVKTRFTLPVKFVLN